MRWTVTHPYTSRLDVRSSVCTGLVSLLNQVTEAALGRRPTQSINSHSVPSLSQYLYSPAPDPDIVMHSASTILDDIVDELRLKYDSSEGLLDGDAIREVPNLNILQNVSKLLAKLSKSLSAAAEKDQALLQTVEAKLKRCAVSEQNSHHQGVAEMKDIKMADHTELEDAGRHNGNSRELEDESIPLAKRRKVIGSELGEVDADRDGSGVQSLAHRVKREESEDLNSKYDPVPPEQSGSYTQDNDTRLKNPHSEFVCSQTLSASAISELGLFSEENNGLETQGEGYLKKKYGVASYPSKDLKDVLPGPIPNIDFSKTKAPTNQVQFTTYQSYIESYFRPFVSDDITFVNEKFVVPPGLDKNYDPSVTPYLIPKLGPLYYDTWAEEDASLGSKLSSPTFQRPPLESFKPKGTTSELTDEKILTEDVSCGPLSSRLLSAVLSIHEMNEKENEKGENDEDDGAGSIKEEELAVSESLFGEDSASQLDSGDVYKVLSDDNDFYSMEERLKRELKYIGIFMNMLDSDDSKTKKGSIIDSDEWIANREDDEVCAELRSLQEELKASVMRNRKRKKQLLPILEEQLAYQEYCTILEDLDKQVDQAYIKRLKGKSKKKKSPQEPVNTAQQQAANSGLRSLLEKRNRWIANIGKLFDPPEVMKRIPSEPVFKIDDQSDDEDGETEVDVMNEEGS